MSVIDESMRNALNYYQIAKGTRQELKDRAVRCCAKQIDGEPVERPFREGNISFITDLNAIAIGTGSYDEIVIIEGKKIGL